MWIPAVGETKVVVHTDGLAVAKPNGALKFEVRRVTCRCSLWLSQCQCAPFRVIASALRPDRLPSCSLRVIASVLSPSHWLPVDSVRVIASVRSPSHRQPPLEAQAACESLRVIASVLSA